MKSVPFVLSSIAIAVLAGCATESGITSSAPAPMVVAPAPAYVVAPAGTVVVQQPAMVVVAPTAAPLRVGMGRIESIQAVPTAAAGGTTTQPTRRIGSRMDDGSLQYFETQAAGLGVGDRIEITKDGTMRHPA